MSVRSIQSNLVPCLSVTECNSLPTANTTHSHSGYPQGLFWSFLDRLSYICLHIFLNFFKKFLNSVPISRIFLSLLARNSPISYPIYTPSLSTDPVRNQTDLIMSQALSSSESRALTLLGQGINPEMTASAVGLSTSRISQLLSDPEFAAQVADLRYKNLAKHNERDSAYDSLEDSLLTKLKDLLPFMLRPMEVLKAIQVINAAKRRGASAPDSITAQQEVINLVMPVQIINQYSVNSHNQVIKAGAQDLVTVQSGRLKDLVAQAKKGAQDVISHSRPTESSSAS